MGESKLSNLPPVKNTLAFPTPITTIDVIKTPREWENYPISSHYQLTSTVSEAKSVYVVASQGLAARKPFADTGWESLWGSRSFGKVQDT